MKKCLLSFVLVAALAVSAIAAQPVISEKQDVAIFALGYYGWNVPFQALGSIDAQIQKVFADLGRFTIVGVTQRLSSGGLDQFVSAIKQAKQANFVLPEKFQFGEAFLTQAEFNRLVGAFIVVIPVVTEFNSFYDSKNKYYQTTIKTSVTFVDVASGGNVIAVKIISSSGTDSQNQAKSVSSAISSIPGSLEFEIRSIPQFQINTRILSVDGSTIKLQMGANMGIRKGDEYAIIQKKSVEGFDDSKEAGLVVVKDVGQEVSSAQVLYTSMRLGKDTQLKEIPRAGSDVDLFFRYVNDPNYPTLMPGLRITAARGFYNVRPYLALQMPLSHMGSFLYWSGWLEILPFNFLLGAEYVMYMGKLAVSPYAGVGLSYIHVETDLLNFETDFLSHVGGQGGARVSYLLNRNTRVFADLGYETWIAINDFWGNTSYGGVSAGLGIAFKL
jgi:opacity protein-like surface antigen